MFKKETLVKFCDRVIEACFYALLVTVTFSNTFTEFFAISMIIAWTLKIALTRDMKWSAGVPAKILFLFVLWNVLSFFNTGYMSETVRGVLKVAKYALLFIAASGIKDEKMIKRTLWVIAVSALLISIDGFVEYHTGVDLLRHRALTPNDYLRRVSASFIHPNDFGVYLVVMNLVLMAAVLSGNIILKARLGLLAAAAASLASLFMTQSRGSWLSFVLAVFVFSALKGKKAVVIFLVVFAAGFMALPLATRERVINIADVKSSGGTTWERLKLWEGTVNMIKVHPVLGFGANTYSRNFPKYKPSDYPDERYAHNSYLQIASEVGIPGAFLLICFFASVFAACIRKLTIMPKSLRKDLALGLIAGLVGFSVNAAVDTHLESVTLSVFFFTLLGFAYSLSLGKNGK